MTSTLFPPPPMAFSGSEAAASSSRPFRPSQNGAANTRGSGLVLAHGSEGEAPVYASTQTQSASGMKQHRFSPYDFNGGTVAAVAGPDYCVVAADTRLSSGYEILSRSCGKLHALTSNTILASSGCKTDVDQLRSVLDIRMKVYQHNHHKDMSSDSCAQLLSNTLYYKRFFPYYAFNILAGVDAQGVGAVYSYDAVGSFERSQYSANGSGQAYIIPVLDNVIGNRNRLQDKPALSANEVVEIFKDTFLSAGERDIYTGDSVDIWVITKDNVVQHNFALKKD